MSFSTSMHLFRWKEGPVKDQGEHTCLAGHGKLEVYQYDIVSCRDRKKPNIKNKLGRKKKKKLGDYLILWNSVAQQNL